MVNLKGKLCCGLVILSIMNIACDVSVGGDGEPVRKKSYEATSNMKFINSSIVSPKDPSSYGQDSYLLGVESRLLLKSDDLIDKTNNVNIDSKFKMALSMYVGRNDLTDEELSAIKLCPLEKNWMVLATWARSHPFQGGEWAKAGGDFNDSACVAVAAYNEDSDILDPIVEPPSDLVTAPIVSDFSTRGSSQTKIQFDITDWFLNGPFAGYENTGFIIVTDVEVLFWSDASGFRPTISWTEPIN